MAVEPSTVELLLAAVAGGAFGAAVGALQAFAFTGFLVIAGEVLSVVQRGVGGPSTLGGVDVTGAVAFGPAFGPHVAFAGGAAGVAYAARQGYVEAEGFDYHPAKRITTGQGARPGVLAVGGIFGAVGMAIAVGSRTVGIPWDPVAVGVVGSALAHRVVLGYSLIGTPTVGGWFDMSPWERGEQTSDGATDAVSADGGRQAVEPWLPYQYEWSHVAALGVAAGALGGYVAYVTASPFLAFGVSAASLLFISAGVDRIPVTHHVTLPASTAVLALVPAGAATTPAAVASAVPLWQALGVGAVAGLAGAIVGELLQRVFYAHAETHLDPPAASIAVTTLALGLLAMAGVLEHAVWIPQP